MKRVLPIALLTIGLISFTYGQLATGQPHVDGSGEATLFVPASIPWKDGPASLPPGAKLAILEGDPATEGPFTVRIKLPDRYRIPPHTHPKTERLTVISGSFRLGMGATFDEKALRAMPPGAFGFWPAGMKHFVQAEGETIVQLHGIGPWQIVYVNPADDPRRAAR
jgi:quercetin dioxygenase-like cupin family protein